MYVQHVNIHQRMDENFSPFIQNITGPNNHLHAYQHTTPCTPINSKTCSHFDTRGITLHGRRTHRQTDRQTKAVHVHLKSPQSTITAAVKHDKVQTLNFCKINKVLHVKKKIHNNLQSVAFHGYS